jgi:cell division protease FtsH
MKSTEQQSEQASDLTSAPSTEYPDGKPGSQKDAGRAKMPPPNVWGWFILILLTNYFLASFLVPSPESPVTIPYTLFKQEVGLGNVDVIYCRGEIIKGHFKAPVMYPPDSAKSATIQEPSRPVSDFTTT